MPQTEARKKANKKYREKNREKLRKYNREYTYNQYHNSKEDEVNGGAFLEKHRSASLKYYHENKETILEKRRLQRKIAKDNKKMILLDN